MEDTTIEDVLKTFEDFYVKKDFANALLTLQKHKQEISPELWHYNAGTVNAKMENWPMARYHLMMAERLGLSASELAQNRARVEEKLGIEKLERPMTAGDHLISIASAAAGGAFTALALLILVVGLIGLRRGASLVKVLVLAVLVALPLGLNWWVKSWPRAVVISPQLVLEGPSNIFASREELPAGVLVITQGSGTWREIIWPSRFAGWVKTSALMKLE